MQSGQSYCSQREMLIKNLNHNYVDVDDNCLVFSALKDEFRQVRKIIKL